MHRSLLRLFVGLARNATPLALLGFFVVAAGVVAESIGVTVTGLAILAIGRLTQIVQIGRYEKRRHEAEVRTKYKGPSSFRVDPNIQNDGWWWSPVGMWAARLQGCPHVHGAGVEAGE